MLQEPKERLGLIARAYWQPLVLFALVLLALGQLYSWGSTFIELKKVDAMIEKTEDVESAREEGSDNPSVSEKPSPGDREKKKPEKNIFKREHIPYKLTAIFMDQAVIDGREVKVGDRVGKAVVKEIGNSHVKILEDGKEHPRTLSMFQGGGGGGPSPRMMRGRPPSRKFTPSSQPKKNSSESRPKTAVKKVKGGGDVLARFKDMSFEERREAFRNLSPEERERVKQAARERFGGRRGGRRAMIRER